MENRERALELHEAGQGDKARTAFQKAIIVTHEMAHELMKVRGRKIDQGLPLSPFFLPLTTTHIPHHAYPRRSAPPACATWWRPTRRTRSWPTSR